MADIKILDETTVCKIAAGEVILSPAFVIKELVENSIDAASREIIIELKGGGLSKISVSDDGSGMTRDEILMALEHHATSKLRDVNDLKKIATYGFRGEALPSIVSISNAEIISSNDSEKPAVCVKIEGGVIKSVQPAASTRGTKIFIKNLFFNTPVRKKFLKSENYETALVTETVTRYALAHPEIKFSLFINERESFSTRANSGILSVINDIFSGDIADNLIEKSFTGADAKFGNISIKAFFAPPHISKPGNRYQYYFVNGRPFRNKSVTHAVMEAYKKHLNPRQYPVLFMFLTMDQQFVDVNIHPTKTEVAFAGEFAIHDMILKMTGDALANLRVMPSAGFERHEDDGVPVFYGFKKTPDEKTPQRSPERAGEDDAYSQGELGLTGSSHLMAGLGREHASHSSMPLNAPQEPLAGVEKTSPGDPPAGAGKSFLSGASRILGQAFSAFIIIEDADKLLIIDQHVAAEKVLYEKILSSLLSRKFNSQSLLIPHIYDLTPHEFQMVSGNHDLFERYGFDVEIFSNNSIAVRAVPDFIEPEAEKELIFEMITAGSAGGFKYDEEFCKKLAAMTSCKGAVKAGKPLNEETMRMLIADLLKCENPYFCPHGRPVIMKMPLSDILQKFKRSL